MAELKAAAAALEGLTMADVKKIATRESYGRTLPSWGPRTTALLCWTRTWRNPPRPVCFKKHFLRGILTVALREANMVSIVAGLPQAA